MVVTLDLDDDLMLSALERAKAAGKAADVFLVEALRKQLIAPSIVPAPGVFDSWLEDAVQRAIKIPPNDCFKLQDLFNKQEWKEVPLHTVFGRHFNKAMEEKGIARCFGKTSQNQSMYRRL